MNIFKSLNRGKTVRFLIRIMLVISAAVLFVLTRFSVTGTFYARQYMGMESQLMQDSVLKNILMFILFLSLSLILGGMWKKLFKTGENKAAFVILLISSAAMFLAGLFFLIRHPYYMEGDQLNTFYGGVYASMEDSDVRYAMFMPGGYFGIYPQQKGLAFIYMILYGFFGDRLFTVMKFFHLIYPQLILYAGYGAMSKSRVLPFTKVLYCLMLLFCLPLYLYLPYMYGDLPSIAFSFCSMYFMSVLITDHKKIMVIPMGIFAALAVFVRMQVWIFVIAAVITLCLKAADQRKKILVLGAALMVLFSMAGTYAVEKYYDSVSGYGHVEGVPSVCWVAMGLRMKDGYPGVYSRLNQGLFEDNGFDADKTAADAKEYIKESLDYMKNDPAYTRAFFSLKLRLEWTNPDYEGFFSSGKCWSDESGVTSDKVPAKLTDLYRGNLCVKALNFANYYQSAVYMACFVLTLICLFGRKKEISSVTVLSLIYMIGGFLFFAVWENKSRYILPFFICLVWCAPIAVNELANLFSGVKKSS